MDLMKVIKYEFLTYGHNEESVIPSRDSWEWNKHEVTMTFDH